MLHRRAFFTVASFTVCVFLLLGVTLTCLFVSAIGLTPTTQPTPTIGSVPMTGAIQVTDSTPDMAMPNATNETTFIVLPQEVGVSVGDTFFVSVFAEDVRNMYGWQVILFFDPTIVECLSVSVPDQQVFSDRYPVSQALIDFNSTEFTKRPLQSIENGEGFVLAGDCLLGQNQTTFCGSGFLCQATFKALSSGSSNLVLSTADVQPSETYYVDEGIDPILPSLSDSSVTVLPK